MYDGKNKRIKAILDLIKNNKQEKRFQLVQQDGEHYFIFKTKAGYEIGRSRMFESQSKMESAIAFLRKEASNTKNSFKLSKKKDKKKRKAKEKYDIKQNAPLGLVGFEGFKSDNNKLHYFHYHDEGGQALLYSKNYEKRGARDAGITEVVKNGDKKKYYKTWKKSKNQFYFSIIDKKGKSFARSRYFSNEKDMLAALKHLRTNVKGFEQEVNVVPVTKAKQLTIKLPKAVKDDVVNAALGGAAAAVATKAIVEEPATTVVEEKIVVSLSEPPIVKPVYESKTPLRKEIIEEKSSSGFPWKWILLALLLFALLATLFKMCLGGEEKKHVPPPTPEPKVTEPVREAPVEPAKLGPTALDLNLTSNTAEARIADFLSLPEVTVPKVFILESVQFPFNSAELTNTSFTQLNNVVRVLTEYPKAKIEVNGHTDSRGDDALNLTLSENRAKAVRTYLLGKGVAADRIVQAVGFGETDPIATNETDEGRQENRRSELVVVAR